MNNLIGKAKVKKNKIVYTYNYDGKEYKIETPRTPLNQGVEQGEVVAIMLGIMPTEDPNKLFSEPSRVIDDE